MQPRAALSFRAAVADLFIKLVAFLITAGICAICSSSMDAVHSKISLGMWLGDGCGCKYRNHYVKC